MTAIPDWEDRLLSGRSLVPALELDPEESARALRIFDRLRLPDVIGKPAMAEAAADWQRRIVAALFGSYDPATDRRALQELFLLVPKKNSKSTLGGALMVTAAIVNRRPNAEFLLIAPTKEIAAISFRQAAGMIAADPELKKLFHVQSHIRTITHKRTDAIVQIKAADTDAITGSKSTGALIDETHVFAQMSRAADVFAEVRGALAARPDGFLVQITTQSKSPPAGVFLAELNRARAVRDGRLDLPLLPVIYEFPRRMLSTDEWKIPENWPLVNPNLGRSVDSGFLAREFHAAEEAGAEALALFASQHLNVEIGVALASDRWAGADHWEARSSKSLTLDQILERCDVIVIGIDGGGLDDLLGLAVLGRVTATRDWFLWVHGWAHPSVLERRKAEAPRLRDFETAGDLTIIAEPGQDVAEIADLVGRIHSAGLLPEKNAIGVDPVGIGQIVDELAARGIEPDRILGIPQGWKLNGAIKTTERKLADGALTHCGQALMAWCVGNAKVEPKGNAVQITKQSAGRAKIDPLMATFNAVALMGMNPESSTIYADGRDLIVI